MKRLAKKGHKMGYCVQCGLPVPDGQNCCSLCYGDPEYGQDGYYRQWLNEQEREQQEQAQAEEAG